MICSESLEITSIASFSLSNCSLSFAVICMFPFRWWSGLGGFATVQGYNIPFAGSQFIQVIGPRLQHGAAGLKVCGSVVGPAVGVPDRVPQLLLYVLRWEA